MNYAEYIIQVNMVY